MRQLDMKGLLVRTMVVVATMVMAAASGGFSNGDLAPTRPAAIVYVDGVRP
jgi:hypothetical protein